MRRVSSAPVVSRQRDGSGHVTHAGQHPLERPGPEPEMLGQRPDDMQSDQGEQRVPEEGVVARQVIAAGEPGGEAEDRHGEEDCVKQAVSEPGEQRGPGRLVFGMRWASVDEPVEQAKRGGDQHERAEDDVGIAEQVRDLVEDLALECAVPEIDHELTLDPLGDDQSDDGPMEEDVEGGPVGPVACRGHDGELRGGERVSIRSAIGRCSRHCRNYTVS
ncbi:hypothetical protein SI859A1_01763 [Aurantimonas manganoxydans SI85-9A1]|uniref:Uncharacterized protein n=1 Tax=Aurantimonas manganoxydans (strain ATCC BAA-1229 / DSM 21871 / SI85-9A1) TaxID=287752 RepID=Q1YL13_AURMS|nr:hypothetical protein SI859A1_01763 [Aurantimonas manganoxydans SI85-9A1]